VTLAHQYLVKPCDAATLRATLENALNLRDILDDPSLTALMGRIVSLPSVPTVYLKLMDALRSDETPVAAIGDIIAEDLAMSAKVLQWVNSPLFGARRPFTSPREAAIYLGVDVVRAMALTESVFAQYDAGPNPCFSVEELRNHSLQVATVARELAQSRHLPQSVVNDVFLGGLMHDLGKLVLGSNFPGQYREVAACFQDPEAARAKELQLFGTTHAEVGGYLLWLWGISGKATEIVVRHHSAGPETPEGQGPPGLVALADAMVRQGARQGARDVLAPRPESLPHEVTQ
jgi:HD-like signal output (HDOD) protein